MCTRSFSRHYDQILGKKQHEGEVSCGSGCEQTPPPSRWGRHDGRDPVQVGRKSQLFLDHISVAEHGKEWNSGSSPFSSSSSAVPPPPFALDHKHRALCLLDKNGV